MTDVLVVCKCKTLDLLENGWVSVGRKGSSKTWSFTRDLALLNPWTCMDIFISHFFINSLQLVWKYSCFFSTQFRERLGAFDYPILPTPFVSPGWHLNSLVIVLNMSNGCWLMHFPCIFLHFPCSTVDLSHRTCVSYFPTLDPIGMNQYYGHKKWQYLIPKSWMNYPPFLRRKIQTLSPSTEVKSSHFHKDFLKPSFRGSSGHLIPFVLSHLGQAMWQMDALQDLQPMWIFDPEMMGGIIGEASVGDGQVLQHSFRSFLLTRFLAVHIWRMTKLEESGWIGEKWTLQKEQRVQKLCFLGGFSI